MNLSDLEITDIKCSQFKDLPDLVSLNVSKNRIGDAGLKEIVKYFAENDSETKMKRIE